MVVVFIYLELLGNFGHVLKYGVCSIANPKTIVNPKVPILQVSWRSVYK